ncbi:unnamed protein product [Sphenostylis stenocarpa]|uniref:FAS1 domain-containing protein n=1 Tax=Sphenostylis stenocarpa TaxID=92480 RepID=A0AA86W6N2_9FABA|nr:unnamed protein product [Sphenostylis stenocarpa]
MKQLTLFSFSFFQLFSSTTFAISPAAPKAAPAAKTPPIPKAAAPSPKPLVPTLPQSPDSPDSVPDGITRILKKAKMFSTLIRLLKTTEIMNNINSQLITAMSGGITILAPDDSAFSNLKAGFLNSLNKGQKKRTRNFSVTDKAPAFAPSSLAKAPKASKENSSEDEQNETQDDHKNRGQ